MFNSFFLLFTALFQGRQGMELAITTIKREMEEFAKAAQNVSQTAQSDFNSISKALDNMKLMDGDVSF